MPAVRHPFRPRSLAQTWINRLAINEIAYKDGAGAGMAISALTELIAQLLKQGAKFFGVTMNITNDV